MSSDDRLRLVDHDDSLHDDQVRYSSRTPRIVAANSTTTRGTAPRQAHQGEVLADAVYGDGNVFVTGERVKAARSSCKYVRAVVAILMLPLFVLLILAITGILPIGWGTHDVPVLPTATYTQRSQQQHIVPTSNPHAIHAQHLQQSMDRHKAPAADKKLPEEQQQVLDDVKNKVAQAVNGASPDDVQKLIDTAFDGALQILGSAGGKEKSANDIAQQLETQLAEQAVRNAAQKALSETQNDPQALLEGVKKVVNKVGGTELTAAKFSDAIKPGVVGPNDEPQEDAVPIRPEPMPQDAPINQEELNQILQNALRRRGSP